MATYPTGIYAPVLIVDGVDYPKAVDVNLQNNEIVAIQTELGIAPSGSAADLVTRLDISTDGNGNIVLTDSSVLTIASGGITITNNLHAVDTQGAASTDDLDTITAAADGFMLVLSVANAARVVTLRHATGNIYMADGRDIVLSSANMMVLLVYSTALTGWRALYSGKRQAEIATQTADYTATVTDEYILVDATSGSAVILLPAATASIGVVLTIKKVDASANTVTVDGNAAETIDGVTTKVLSAQYASISIICDGSTWSVV